MTRKQILIAAAVAAAVAIAGLVLLASDFIETIKAAHANQEAGHGQP